MFEITAIPAFRDNYIWLLHDGRHAVVVDPGDAAPVEAQLARMGLELIAILITHHHQDHTGGNASLLAGRSIPVYGPAGESIATVTRPLEEGDAVRIDALDAEFDVLAVPGHTAGHIAYIGHGTVFCGDTLFACGCGRLFEGTPAQMARSLGKLAALPPETKVYCAHEYTAGNIRFARAVEPLNDGLARLEAHVAQERAAGRATVPTTIASELATNPFLRCGEPALAAAVAAHAGVDAADEVAVFAALREWKNVF